MPSLKSTDVDAALVYPRVYRPDKTIRIIFTSLAGVFAIFVPLRMLLEHAALSSGLFVMLLVWGMAFFFVYSANQQVILYDDAIEKITWFSRRTLKRDEILGWYGSVGKRYGGYTYFFVSRDKSTGNIRLAPIFRWDKHFFEWKRGIPHLKA